MNSRTKKIGGGILGGLVALFAILAVLEPREESSTREKPPTREELLERDPAWTARAEARQARENRRIAENLGLSIEEYREYRQWRELEGEDRNAHLEKWYMIVEERTGNRYGKEAAEAAAASEEPKWGDPPTAEEERWLTASDKRIFMKEWWGPLARARIAVGGEALSFPVLDSIREGKLAGVDVIVRDLATGDRCSSKLMLERNNIIGWLIGYSQPCEGMICTRSSDVFMPLSGPEVHMRSAFLYDLAFAGAGPEKINEVRGILDEVDLPGMEAELEAEYGRTGRETVPYAANCR